VDSNAGELTLNIDGFSHKGEKQGDWTLVLKKRAKPKRKAA